MQISRVSQPIPIIALKFIQKTFDFKIIIFSNFNWKKLAKNSKTHILIKNFYEPLSHANNNVKTVAHECASLLWAPRACEFFLGWAVPGYDFLRSWVRWVFMKLNFTRSVFDSNLITTNCHNEWSYCDFVFSRNHRTKMHCRPQLHQSLLFLDFAFWLEPVCFHRRRKHNLKYSKIIWQWTIKLRETHRPCCHYILVRVVLCSWKTQFTSFFTMFDRTEAVTK